MGDHAVDQLFFFHPVLLPTPTTPSLRRHQLPLPVTNQSLDLQHVLELLTHEPQAHTNPTQTPKINSFPAILRSP